jgi:hypothetical protein
VKIIADLKAGRLTLPGAEYPVSCRVRTVKDGTRRTDEVVYSIPGGLPYDPRQFPRGLWNITAVEWQADRGFDRGVYGPVKIRTGAWQRVKVWALDEDGDYFRETLREALDSGYLLHYSDSGTTLGCIRLDSPADALAIGKAVEAALKDGPVELEVL